MLGANSDILFPHFFSEISGTIFAYGQTGTGKTFTMEGTSFIGYSSLVEIEGQAVQHCFQK